MKRDLYQTVTDQIVTAINTGNIPWETRRNTTKGIQSGVSSLPMNGSTGVHYRGINIVTLWGAACDQGYEDLRFMTFKQAKASGGCVRRGEKGHKIYFFKPLEIRDESDPDNVRKVPMLREYTVFHISQIDGIEKLGGEATASQLPEDVPELAQAIDCDLRHGPTGKNSNGFYVPSQDYVQVWPPQSFKSEGLYRSVLYHELVHWTGHQSRCDRKFGMTRNGPDYASEELVAELGAAFLCAEYGLDYTTVHASYLSRYLKVLKDDKRAIFQAASKAQQAVDWIKAKALADIPTAQAA